MQRLTNGRGARSRTINSDSIRWIEKLLQTPVADYRKFAVWRILAPYLINIRKCSVDEAYKIITDWLDRCSQLRRLDFNAYHVIKYNIDSAKKNGHLPRSLEKLKTDNTYLYNAFAKP